MTQNTQGIEAAPVPLKRFDWAYWWDRVGIALVLLVLVVLMATIAPNFLSLDNLLNVARSVSVNAILAAGMTFVILTGGIDLSVGSILGVSGVSGVLLFSYGLPAWICVLGGILAGAVAGLLNGVLVAYLALAAFIVTLGSMTFLRGLAYTLTGGEPVVASDLNYRLIGNSYVLGVPLPVILMLAVYVLAWVVLERTKLGRHIYAVGGNAEAARLAGIKVKSVMITVYVFAGACAGLGGIIYSARVVSGQPTAGTSYELDAIAAVVLGGTSLAGGRGRIVGTLVGAMILGVLNNGLVLLNVPFFTQLMIKGVVIVLAVTIDGLKGSSLGERPLLGRIFRK